MPSSAQDGNDLKGIYHGVVVNNADPLRLGRVQFRIPGLVEPKSSWAFPAGGLMGGTAARGSFSAPKVEADIVAVFIGGDPDVPVYFSGHYGEKERPAYLDDDGSGEKVPPEDCHYVTIVEDDRWEIVLDSRPSNDKAKLRLRDKLTDDEILMEKGGINIQATALIHIKCAGAFVLDANSVTIVDRPVISNGKPID